MSSSASMLVSHRRLLWRVSRTELRSRYAGSVLGILWAMLGPWLLLGLYAVIYLFIFHARVKGMTSVQYVLFVFSGLIPYFMTAECIGVGVGSVTSNKSVIENKIFPIDLVPPKAILVGQMPMIAGMPIVIAGVLLIGRGSWTMALLPVLWALHLLAMFGLLWILSLINVVFRDLQNLMQVVLMALLIASPFAYTADMVPPTLQPLILLNPFAYYVIAYQDILVRQQLPPTYVIAFVVLFSLGLFWAGNWVFSRAKQVIIDYV